MMFGVLGVLNLAHASVFTWGALVGLAAATRLQLSLPSALLLGSLAGGALSVLIEWVAFRSLRARGNTSELAPFISSLGVLIILTSLAQFATDTRVLRYPPDTYDFGAIRAAGLQISNVQLGMLAVSVVLMIALKWLLASTRFGKAIRAVATSSDVSRLLGINADRVFAQVAFIAGCLGGAAGVLVGVAFNSVQFAMGDQYLLKALTIIVVGGFGSVGGAVVGGILLGMTEALSVALFGTTWRDMIAFGLLLVVLLLRPSGLFGTEERLAT
jgi:branched-chain amino acid transport system permease protein